jgi:hypothetical protein
MRYLVVLLFLSACAQPYDVIANAELELDGLSEVEKANYFLPEAVYAVADAIYQVWGIEVSEYAIETVKDIDIEVSSKDNMPKGLVGQAWCDPYPTYTIRGITIQVGLSPNDRRVIIVHEVLHHLADMANLPGANWIHESTKTWRCDDSVEAIASRMVGAKFATGYSQKDCK